MQRKGKAKAKVFLKKRDPWARRYHNDRPRRDFPIHTTSMRVQLINSLFKEPVYQILEKIKNESFFEWPNRMGGDPSKRNLNLYCHYHRDKRHTIEDCRTLRDYLNQLAKSGKLSYFLHQPVEQLGHSGSGMHGNDTLRPALGIINVILARPGGDVRASSGVMSVVRGSDLEARDQTHKRTRVMVPPSLSFSVDNN